MKTNHLLHQTLPTEFNGRALIAAYDRRTGLYKSSTGLHWKLVGGVLVTPPEKKGNGRRGRNHPR